MPSPSDDSAAREILSRSAEELGGFFDALLRSPAAPPRLIEAIRYSLMAGGKRLRPALVLETFRCVSSASSLPAPPGLRSSALAAAAAIELIHTFSLVHDDLPAMDDDDLRRGAPTNHKVFGEAMAILAGDAMVTLAFEALASNAHPDVSATLVAELARAAGPEGMIGGQVLDIDGENRRLSLGKLQDLHARKTGALLTCAVRMGAAAGGASDEQLQAVTRFGRHLGLAFQIVDDLLDVTATREQLGKATQKDSAKGKNTYPALLGLDGARAEAAVQLRSALDALETFGPSSAGMRSLARFVVERSH